MHDIAQRAAEAARVPSFEDVLARGRRRRNRRNGLVAAAAALAVAAIVGCAQLLGPDDSREPQFTPSPGPTTISDPNPGPSGTGAAAIIDHPGAQVADAAVTPGNVDSRAVIWRVVNQSRYGLTITDDGFITRTDVLLPEAAEVFAGADGRFVVRDAISLHRLWVADVGGDLVRVRVSGAEAPVGRGEVAVGVSSGLVAVDTRTAEAHPVPTSPDDAWGVRSFGGRLTAISNVVDGSGARESTYHWSDDGGASWQTATFDPGELGNAEVVLTPAGTDHWILMLGDGATVGPLMAVLQMPADGSGFVATEYDGETVSQSGAFVVDTELRLLADFWGGGGPVHDSGLYRWDAGELIPIDVDTPDPTTVAERTLVAADVTEAAPVMWVAAGSELFESASGGLSWDELRAR